MRFTGLMPDGQTRFRNAAGDELGDLRDPADMRAGDEVGGRELADAGPDKEREIVVRGVLVEAQEVLGDERTCARAAELAASGDRVLVLGGVVFEGEPGLIGHSDADVVAHACADALLGAAGLGDIGQHFPDTDPTWAGADSIGLLTEVAGRVRAAGWEPGNVDCAVVCEAPKIAPRRAEMEAKLSAAAGAPISVKGRRAEGLGALGRQEGIAVWAVAVITKTTMSGNEGTP